LKPSRGKKRFRNLAAQSRRAISPRNFSPNFLAQFLSAVEPTTRALRRSELSFDEIFRHPWQLGDRSMGYRSLGYCSDQSSPGRQ
jgi:hypothetical protein